MHVDSPGISSPSENLAMHFLKHISDILAQHVTRASRARATQRRTYCTCFASLSLRAAASRRVAAAAAAAIDRD